MKGSKATGYDAEFTDVMDPRDPRMIKFKADLSGMDISNKEFRPHEFCKRYGFNPTQSRKICKRMNEAACMNSGKAVKAVKPVTGHDEDNSVDGVTEDTSDFATAAPGSRILKK